MKRYLFPILFVLVLVMPAVVSRWVKKETATVVVPAGAVQIDVISPHNQDIRNAFAPAFSNWHQAKYGKPVDVRFTNVGGTGDITRYLRSSYSVMNAGKLPDDFRPPFDLVWGGGDAFFDRDIKPFLQTIQLPPGVIEAALPNPILNGVRLYDWNEGRRDIKWVGICISSFGIVYNPDVYQRLKLPAPETWKDLAREELAGWIALANPMSSSSAATAYSMDFQRAMADEEAAYLKDHPDLAKLTTKERMKNPGYYAAVKRGWKRGMGELLLVSANGRYITDSGSQPPNDVANGDAAAAMAIDFYGRANEFQMGEKRVKLIFPKGASAMNPDPIAILAGVTGEKKDIANHFIEFLLSTEGQRLWQLAPSAAGGPPRALFRSPIRRDVYADRANWTNPTVNPFDDEEGFFKRDEWEEIFYETRFLWAISWIDAREELKDAYAAILRVSDTTRREHLREKLADFPVSYDDLLKIKSDLAKVEKSKVGEERARRRLDLARKFRDHYQAIEAEARGTVAAR